MANERSLKTLMEATRVLSIIVNPDHPAEHLPLELRLPTPRERDFLERLGKRLIRESRRQSIKRQLK